MTHAAPSSSGLIKQGVVKVESTRIGTRGADRARRWLQVGDLFEWVRHDLEQQALGWSCCMRWPSGQVEDIHELDPNALLRQRAVGG
jgi:hypothetical protein